MQRHGTLQGCILAEIDIHIFCFYAGDKSLSAVEGRSGENNHHTIAQLGGKWALQGKKNAFQIFGSQISTAGSMSVLLPFLTILLLANPSYGLKCHQCNSSLGTLEAICVFFLSIYYQRIPK